ncbi:hypothetical protein [Legionella waltersii]|uniref:hypothetical protein n=1 Tax=Legionella waltersii TaxID=66969 RepID=UPI000AD7E25A|nr:hypothetical protein [Legionella waltersii]
MAAGKQAVKDFFSHDTLLSDVPHLLKTGKMRALHEPNATTKPFIDSVNTEVQTGI